MHLNSYQEPVILFIKEGLWHNLFLSLRVFFELTNQNKVGIILISLFTSCTCALIPDLHDLWKTIDYATALYTFVYVFIFFKTTNLAAKDIQSFQIIVDLG